VSLLIIFDKIIFYLNEQAKIHILSGVIGMGYSYEYRGSPLYADLGLGTTPLAKFN
jgi:hypothetical protein